MHHIEPFFRWRDEYIADEDEHSPFYQRTYSEFAYTNTIYNYYIHPQWDEFGSTTLYVKILYVNYETRAAVLEFIGEWNDCLHNDVMFLKVHVLDIMLAKGLSRFVIIAENVLNFHGSDDCYYEEWNEEAADSDGWICFLNLHQHVEDEMRETGIHRHVLLGSNFNNINWRPMQPDLLIDYTEELILKGNRELI